MSKFYWGPSIDTSYQVSYHLTERFQRKSCFRNWPIRNKNCLWWPCLWTDQNGTSNSHRGPSIDASYQVSVYLAKLCQSRKLLEIDQSEKKNCLWRPCLLTDWDKMSNLYKRTFHRCFLPSFGSFGRAVSEEKMFRNGPIRNKNHLWWPCLLMDCRSVLDTSLCDKVCLWLQVGRWFSPSTLVSSTNKTGRHDITEILLKVALSTITLNPNAYICKLLTSISLRKPRSKWYYSSLLLHGILR